VTDIPGLIMANLIFSIQVAPGVLIAVSIIRGLILITGQKREFEDWTRNWLLTFLSWVFLPGTIVYVALRWGISKLFRIDVENIGLSTTYAELNLFIKVEKPPRVAVALTFLYATVVLSVFTACSLIVLPFVFLLEAPMVLILWYVALGVFFNTSLRSGDISLVAASLRRRPRSGVLELIVVMAALIILYAQFAGVFSI
jgi:hypothetical protein